MRYQHLTAADQLAAVVDRARALEAAHWAATVAAAEADADPRTDGDVAEAKRVDLASLEARLDVLAELAHQLRNPAATDPHLED